MKRWTMPGLFRFGARRTKAKTEAAGRARLRRRPGFRAIFRPGIGESGETMLEFAFVAPMLILLLLTIVDLGIMLMSQSLLDGATRDAARLVRTGDVNNTSGTVCNPPVAVGGSAFATFQACLCSEMSPIMNSGSCQQNILIEVNTATTFSGVSFSACGYNQGQTANGTECPFSAGNAGSIVGVQVTYNRKFIVPWVGACLSGQACWMGLNTKETTTSGNAIPLVSTVIFRNEPYIN